MLLTSWKWIHLIVDLFLKEFIIIKGKKRQLLEKYNKKTIKPKKNHLKVDFLSGVYYYFIGCVLRAIFFYQLCIEFINFYTKSPYLILTWSSPFDWYSRRLRFLVWPAPLAAGVSFSSRGVNLAPLQIADIFLQEKKYKKSGINLNQTKSFSCN